jgi:hypothetical protein
MKLLLTPGKTREGAPRYRRNVHGISTAIGKARSQNLAHTTPAVKFSLSTVLIRYGSLVRWMQVQHPTKAKEDRERAGIFREDISLPRVSSLWCLSCNRPANNPRRATVDFQGALKIQKSQKGTFHWKRLHQAPEARTGHVLFDVMQYTGHQDRPLR